MDGKKAKTLAQKLKENPYSGGGYDLLNDQYKPPQGQNFFQKAIGQVKEWMTPTQQYDPSIVETMKSYWSSGMGEGKANWSSNYMDFNDFLKKKYYLFATSAQTGNSPSISELGDNR